MTTPRRWGAFTEADVSSAIKGAMEAGLHVVSARIGISGDIELLTAEAPQPELAAPGANEAQITRRASVRSAPRRMASASDPLFQSEEDLRGWIAPHLSRPAFARLITELERYGFPRVRTLFHGRYAPAVRAWLDADAGMGRMKTIAIDGKEEWHEAERNAGTRQAQARP